MDRKERLCKAYVLRHGEYNLQAYLTLSVAYYF